MAATTSFEQFFLAVSGSEREKHSLPKTQAPLRLLPTLESHQVPRFLELADFRCRTVLI